MDLTQSDDDDNGDIDSNGGSTIDLTMSDSEDEDEAQTPQAQTPQKVEPPEEGESPEQRRADADMNILLSIGASIGARADDVRSMRMTDIGTSMVAGLGKSASLEGSECMTLVVTMTARSPGHRARGCGGSSRRTTTPRRTLARRWSDATPCSRRCRTWRT